MPTKLGPHVLTSFREMTDYIEAGPAVVKLVADWGYAQEIPKSILVIGRRFERNYDAQHQRYTGQTPLEAAQQFLRDQMPTYKSNPDIIYWEGHNEPVWHAEEDMAWYAQFEVERMRLMAEEGLKCVIGNFSTGTPELELWPPFLPALQAAKEYGAILGLHEYSCPWMWWMTGKHQPDTFPSDDEGDEGWTTLRYRKVYRQHLIPNGLGTVPLVITECGIDPGVGHKPPQVGTGGTWKQLGNFWSQHDGERDNADYYFQQLKWYDEELQKDDYVVGATVFTWGSFPGTWRDFDVAGTSVAQKLIAYTKANPAAPFPPVPIVTIEEVGFRFSEHWSERRGQKVRYIIVHSTDSEDTSAENRLDFLLGPNDRQVSVHELVLPEGQVYRLVPDARAAHHCESEGVRFPDGTPADLANEITWGIEAFQVGGEPVAEDVLAMTIERIAAACRRFRLDPSCVLGHREIDPDRQDPVGVDMDELRATLDEVLLRNTLFKQAETRQLIQLNPDAALQRQIFGDGFVPNSPEFDVEINRVRYRAQRAEHLETGKVRVYFAKVPDWHDVRHFERL